MNLSKWSRGKSRICGGEEGILSTMKIESQASARSGSDLISPNENGGKNKRFYRSTFGCS